MNTLSVLTISMTLMSPETSRGGDPFTTGAEYTRALPVSRGNFSTCTLASRARRESARVYSGCKGVAKQHVAVGARTIAIALDTARGSPATLPAARSQCHDLFANVAFEGERWEKYIIISNKNDRAAAMERV